MYGGYGGFVALFFGIAAVVFYFVAVIAWAILRVLGYALVWGLLALGMWIKESGMLGMINRFVQLHYFSIALAGATFVIVALIVRGVDSGGALLLILVSLGVVVFAAGASFIENRTIKL